MNKKPIKLAGHALLWDWLPFSGCECGTDVPKSITTRKEAREWHRQHKAEYISIHKADVLRKVGQQ
jgi:hypothetical protein